MFLISGILLFISSNYLYFLKLKEKKVLKVDEKQSTLIPDKTISNGNNRTILVWVLICLFFVGLIIVQRRATYIIYLHAFFITINPKNTGFIFAINPFLIVLLQVPLVNLFGNYNKMMVVGMGAFFIGLGMFILTLSFTLINAILASVIYSFGEMIFTSVAQLICYQNGGQKKKGQSLGLYQTVYACSAVVGPTIGGLIYHHLGGNTLWYISGIIGLICLIICINHRQYA